MKFATFETGGRQTWGVLAGSETLADLGAAPGCAYPSLLAALTAGKLPRTVAELPRTRRYPIDEVAFLPPVPVPGRILCVGLNYAEHAAESSRAASERPTLFSRFADTLVGHRGPIVRPRISEQLDYEGELAVVIGKEGRYIHRARASDHIAAYSCFNDGSVRDWQFHTSQFLPGKNFPSTAGFGPFLVTPDEIADFDAARVRTTVNGKKVQEAVLGEMIHDPAAVISYCSSFCTLRPGDVIALGTPAGVGFRKTPPVFLAEGDVVAVEIDSIGRLENPVIREA